MNNGYFKELSEIIRSQEKILAYGGKTKTALEAPEHIPTVDMAKIEGILEYQPDEYTFTAYAGTKLRDIDQMLAEHGQFMPFDPPLIKHGATLGGTVAANLSGPGRYRFGGVRDFILGVKFFDYQAKLIRSGGKVVKNAAGFDISKLMVGSLGSLGAMVELSFKVFPKPPEYRTAVSRLLSLDELLDSMIRLTASPMEFYGLDIESSSEGYFLRARLGGVPKLFPKRIERLHQILGDIEILEGIEEKNYWEVINEFSWVQEETLLIKVPITPSSVAPLDKFLGRDKSKRRYSNGANVAWIAWSKPIELIDQKLTELKLGGLTVLGKTDQVRLGFQKSGIFYQRIKNALDPVGKWAEV